MKITLWAALSTDESFLNFKLIFLSYYFYSLCTVFNTASSVAPWILLLRRMLGSTPELLRLRHWQSGALTTRLDLTHRWKLVFVMQVVNRLRRSLLRLQAKSRLASGMLQKAFFMDVVKSLWQMMQNFCLPVLGMSHRVSLFRQNMLQRVGLSFVLHVCCKESAC